jgi:hypothetical protein
MWNGRSEPSGNPVRHLWGVIAAITLAASIWSTGAHGQVQTPGGASADEAAIQSARAECANRLSQFVGEMDKILTEDPRSVRPLLDLLKKYFPVQGCDVEESIKICRASKYLVGVSRDRDVDVFVFDSSKFWRWRSGFMVSFGLRKPSGDSELPYAQVNK